VLQALSRDPQQPMEESSAWQTLACGERIKSRADVHTAACGGLCRSSCICPEVGCSHAEDPR